MLHLCSQKSEFLIKVIMKCVNIDVFVKFNNSQ